MAVSLPVASKPATGDDGAVSSTTCWIVLLCFVLFSVANIIVTYVCALLKPPTRGVCDSSCNCTPIVVNKICLKQFPAQRPVTRSFDVFFDLRLNKRLSKQWWGWWFETLPRPLWCHSKDITKLRACHYQLNTWTRSSVLFECFYGTSQVQCNYCPVYASSTGHYSIKEIKQRPFTAWLHAKLCNRL